MNIHKQIRLLPGLAVGILLVLGMMVVLVAAQKADGNEVPLVPLAVHADLLDDGMEHPPYPVALEGGAPEPLAGVRPPGSFDAILLADDFQWNRGWSWSGLWYQTFDLLDVGSNYSRTHSAVIGMRYGYDATGTYDDGSTNSGVLTNPHPIQLPFSALSVTVSFWSWEETEQSGGPRCGPPPAVCNWDVRRLEISGNISTSWEILWSTQSNPTVEGQWHQVVGDISAYRGQSVRLRFIFDTGDALHNGYEGWYVDDVAVISHGVLVPGYDLTDSWAQSFDEDYPNPTPDLEVHVDRVAADGVTAWQVTDDPERQSYVAVAAHPVRDIPVVWTHFYTTAGGVPVGDVEYKTLNWDGSPSVPLAKITDHSGAIFPSLVDRWPTVAVNPVDGNTVVAWTRCLSCPVSYMTRVYNVYYAIRGSTGTVVVGPTALTNNTSRVREEMLPAVETFPNGNILIAWQRTDRPPQPPNPEDIFYTVLDRSGNTIKPTGNLSGNPGSHSAHVRLARLADGNMLAVWEEGPRNLSYAVVDASGNVVKAPTNLTNYDPAGDRFGLDAEALGLANGNSIIAWSEGSELGAVTQNRYLVVDSTYNIVKAPATLFNPYNAMANGPVSMVADEADAAILTWPSASHPYLHIYYARLDNQGNLLVGPTIYRQTRGSRIFPSWVGYGVGELPPCWLDGVSLAGPTTGTSGRAITFVATVTPPSATLPISYTWQATGQTPVARSASRITDSATFAWTVGGPQTVTVTAANCGGSVSAQHVITIQHEVFLPVVLRNYSN
jgi:hypothetical protein